MQRHPIQHCGMSSFPHHEHNKEGESPWSLKVGHRCNVTSQRLMNGGGPTWCPSHHGGKMFEAKRIKRMTGWINNQAPTLSLMQDFNCVHCKSKGKLERMLRKDWLFTISEIFSWNQCMDFLQDAERGIHTTTPP